MEIKVSDTKEVPELSNILSYADTLENTSVA
jgi:hypothetical protein